MGNKGSRARAPPPKPGRPAAPPRPNDGRCNWQPYFYLEANPDLQNAFGWDYNKVKEHWINHGHREGRSPCGNVMPECRWDDARYNSLHPDVVAARYPAFQHVRQHGLNEGRAICWPAREEEIRKAELEKIRLEEERIKAEEDRKRAAEEAEAERVATEWNETVYKRQLQSANRLGPDKRTVPTSAETEHCIFHWEDYNRMYPEILGKGVTEEVIEAVGGGLLGKAMGMAMGIIGGVGNRDLGSKTLPESAFTDADKDRLKTHYAVTGTEEGRTPCGKKMPHCAFDPVDYLQRYPDIKEKGYTKETAADHFRSFGLYENRIVCSQHATNRLDQEITGCDTGDKKIRVDCASGHQVDDGFIEYGRWDNTICPSLDEKGNVARYGGITGKTSFVRRKYPLPRRCIGANSCELGPELSADTGQDPMPNVYKHYRVRYRCVPSPRQIIGNVMSTIHRGGGKGFPWWMFRR